MRRSTPVLATVALVALTGCGAAGAATAPPTRATLTARAATATATITTNGTGTVSGTPDVMTIQIGVDNTAVHAATALAANNAIATQVQATLLRRGVARRDIQTSELSLDSDQGRDKRTAYEVSDVVTATLRSLSTAGVDLEAALSAAGDAGRLEGASFSIADDAPLLAQARRAAVADARTDAEQLAAAAGSKVVVLRSITDQTQQDGIYPEAASGASSASPAGVPVQPGTEQTTVQVTAVWAVTSSVSAG